jgi:hypothetical protein
MDKQVGPGEEQSRRAARERAFRRYAHINKQLLSELYYVQGLSTVDIAKQLGVCRNVIWEYMEMYGLERRKPGEAGAMKSRRHYLDEAYFAQVGPEDDDKVYIAGFILGDGTLIDRESSKRLQIGLSDDDGSLLEQIAARLGDPTLVKRSIKPRTSAERPKALLRIDSVQLVNDLVTLGIPLGRKSGNEPFIQFPTDRLTWSFLRGVFDADGHIRVYERSGNVKGVLYGPYRRARWSITCGLPFVSGLRAFLLARGYTLGEKCLQPKQGTGLIEIADQETIRRIGAAMYQYGSLWLLRKKRIFDMLA